MRPVRVRLVRFRLHLVRNSYRRRLRILGLEHVSGIGQTSGPRDAYTEVFLIRTLECDYLIPGQLTKVVPVELSRDSIYFLELFRCQSSATVRRTNVALDNQPAIVHVATSVTLMLKLGRQKAPSWYLRTFGGKLDLLP